MKSYLIKNFGYDAGHALLGGAIGLVLFSLGVAPVLAAVLGGTLYAIPKEIYDMNKYKPFKLHVDNFSDLASYQTSWPAVFWAAKEPWIALFCLAVVGVGYFALVAEKLRKYARK